MADDRGLAAVERLALIEITKVTVAERLHLLEVRLYKEVRKFPIENQSHLKVLKI